jgi:CRP-like cAMP-binding protein
MTDIIDYLMRLGINKDELEQFLKLLKKKTYKSGDTILLSGQVDNYLGFLRNGLIRFYVNSGKKELAFDFIFPKSFFCHYDSYYSRKPTRFNSEALTDIEIYVIHRHDLASLFQTCEFAKELSRFSVEKLLEKKVKRELTLLTNSPEERYLSLLREQPMLPPYSSEILGYIKSCLQL